MQTYFLLKPVTMSLKIQKILLMNSINFFVTVASKIKDPIETSNFDKLQKFVMKKFLQTPIFQYQISPVKK